ncbi:hypothetical protein E2C01_001483 [Portunus trituberculatus]|uniref:Uncharacterized protein n=1 Tax=Portunus trituberculatus TaxID=210409 RepID=A0A5B7CI32_PORTR|nr:hypothetical protein [Portunus trituberculatus]
MLWPKQWPPLKTEDAAKTLLPDLGGSVPSGAASPYSSVQSFVDHPTSYPSVSAASISTDALYETMSMTQSNSNHVYSPPLATSLGKSCTCLPVPFLLLHQHCQVPRGSPQSGKLSAGRRSFMVMGMMVRCSRYIAYTWPAKTRGSAGGLTPLTPITMQDVKPVLAASSVLDTTASQYHQATAGDLPVQAIPLKILRTERSPGHRDGGITSPE